MDSTIVHGVPISVVSPTDHFDRWHQVTCRDFSHTECLKTPRKAFSASISELRLGPVSVNSIWCSPSDAEQIHIRRQRGDIRRDPRDHFMIWLSLGGTTIFEQNDREVVLQGNDLMLHDQARPFSLRFPSFSHAITVQVPRTLVMDRLRGADCLTAMPLRGTSPLGALAGGLVRQLATLRGSVDDTTSDRIALSALDMITTAFETQLSGAQPSRPDNRFDQLKSYIRDRLQDPDLNLEQIASDNNMSLRTLSRLFVLHGTTPMKWVWHERLNAAYREIADGSGKTITTVAYTCGFNDLSHFSRSFKALFGMTPQQVRQTSGTARKSL